MLTWIEDNQSLIIALIALFGAGGAGTVVIKKLLSGKTADKSGPVHITATADNGGYAIAHAGHGNASIEINKHVDLEQFKSIAAQHGLSPLHANRLIEAASQKGLDLGLIGDTSLDVAGTDALQSALEAKDYDQVKALFQGQSNSKQDHGT